MIKKELLQKLQYSLILKDREVIEPYLMQDLLVLGVSLKRASGDNDREKFLNIIGMCKFGGNIYYFKSQLIENFEEQFLKLDYYVFDEISAQMEVRIEIIENKIKRINFKELRYEENFWGCEHY